MKQITPRQRANLFAHFAARYFADGDIQSAAQSIAGAWLSSRVQQARMDACLKAGFNEADLLAGIAACYFDAGNVRGAAHWIADVSRGFPEHQARMRACAEAGFTTEDCGWYIRVSLGVHFDVAEIHARTAKRRDSKSTMIERLFDAQVLADRYFDRRDTLGAAQWIARARWGSYEQQVRMRACAAAGFAPEYYGRTIRVEIPA